MTNTSEVQSALAEEKGEHSSTLTLSGGGNTLLVHLGAMHRLYELKYLKGTTICGFAFTPKEEEILAEWSAKVNDDFDNIECPADAFGLPVRALRHERHWLKQWIAPSVQWVSLEQWVAKLYRPPDCDVAWGAEDIFGSDGSSWSIGKERHKEMKRLALSPGRLSDLGMDYLIDWGYVLCDTRLSPMTEEDTISRKDLISSTPTAFASPNRIFYRSFEHVSNMAKRRDAAIKERADGKKTLAEESRDRQAA
jgi:hypothetical protein